MDGGKPRTAKFFSLDPAELWVEALVAGEEGLTKSDAISFPAMNIEYVRALGNKASLIRLKSGLEIAFDLPKDQLMDRLQNPDGPVLDLKSVSYLEKKAALIERLRERFKREADDEKYAALEKMTYRAWVRPPNKAEFKELVFSGEDVRMRDISAGSSIMGGSNICFKMKDPSKAPFEGSDFIMEGSLEEFQRMARDAYGRGQAQLDLRAYSLLKGTVTAEERAKAQQQKGPNP